jgi:hypothetical protein
MGLKRTNEFRKDAGPRTVGDRFLKPPQCIRFEKPQRTIRRGQHPQQTTQRMTLFGPAFSYRQ